MFNTLHFFLAALFWRLSEKPPTWTPFISARLNIQIKKTKQKKKNPARCGSNRLPLPPLHSPRVIESCKLMCGAQQGSAADYGPDSGLGWIQDGCRGRISQMFPRIYPPDHVRVFFFFFEYLYCTEKNWFIRVGKVSVSCSGCAAFLQRNQAWIVSWPWKSCRSSVAADEMILISARTSSWSWTLPEWRPLI